MLKRKTCLALALLCLVVGACRDRRADLVTDAPLASRSVTDGLRRNVSLPGPARKVAALSPDLAETVLRIAGPQALVAVPATTPAATPTGVTRMQTYPTLDLAQLAALQPDLVLVDAAQYTPALAGALIRLQVPVYVQGAASVDDVLQSFRDVGVLLGREAAATPLADSLQRLVRTARERTRREVQYPTVLLLPGDTLRTTGARSHLHDLLTAAGARNVFGHWDAATPALPADSLWAAQPEILLLPTNDDQWLRNYLTANPRLATLPVLQQEKVFQVVPDELLTTGPRVGEALVLLLRILHPQVNPDSLVRAAAAAR